MATRRSDSCRLLQCRTCHFNKASVVYRHPYLPRNALLCMHFSFNTTLVQYSEPHPVKPEPYHWFDKSYRHNNSRLCGLQALTLVSCFQSQSLKLVCFKCQTTAYSQFHPIQVTKCLVFTKDSVSPCEVKSNVKQLFS